MISPKETARLQAAGMAALAFAAAFILIGFFLGRWVDSPAPAQGLATSAQPAERRAPNDVTAAREPVKKAEPAMPAPEGATVTGTAVATFRPRPLPQPKDATGGDAHISPETPACSCEDVKVDITTFKDETGERWQFSSPNAEVVQATHKPVLGQIVGNAYRNALGMSWRPEQGGENVFGVVYQRDVWERLRVGGKVEYEKENGLQGELQAVVRY